MSRLKTVEKIKQRTPTRRSPKFDTICFDSVVSGWLGPGRLGGRQLMFVLFLVSAADLKKGWFGRRHIIKAAADRFSNILPPLKSNLLAFCRFTVMKSNHVQVVVHSAVIKSTSIERCVINYNRSVYI